MDEIPDVLSTSDNRLLKALEELKAIDDVRDKRRKQRGYKYYRPNPKQLECHGKTSRKILFCGGNRSGKSTFGAVELSYHLTKDYPDFMPPSRRFKGPIKAAIVATDNNHIERVIEPKLKDYLPLKEITKMKRISGSYLNRIYYQDGSTVDILTNEQDDMAFEGHDWDFVWVDEPLQVRKYQGIERGLVDRGGYMIFTFTPLIEPWMKDDLVDKADNVKISFVQADIRDNKFNVDGDPILLEENIQSFEASMPEDVRKTRIHGEFFHLRGQVYTEFSAIHQVDFKYVYPDPVICVLDPHDRQPHFVIWAFIDRTDDIFVHTEISKQGTIKELSAAIRFVERQK